MNCTWFVEASKSNGIILLKKNPGPTSTVSRFAALPYSDHPTMTVWPVKTM